MFSSQKPYLSHLATPHVLSSAPPQPRVRFALESHQEYGLPWDILAAVAIMARAAAIHLPAGPLAPAPTSLRPLLTRNCASCFHAPTHHTHAGRR